jgi:hexosaminidase
VGSTSYQDADWLGFEGPDLEAVIDLGAPTEVRRAAVRCLQNTGVGIYLPTKVEVALSEDGREFRPAVEAKSEVSPREAGPLVRVIGADMKAQPARFVRVRAVNTGVIPAGQPAAGQKAWLFVDEIVVAER